MNRETPETPAETIHEVNGTPLSEMSYKELLNLDLEHTVQVKDEEAKMYSMLVEFNKKKNLAGAIKRELAKRDDRGETND